MVTDGVRLAVVPLAEVKATTVWRATDHPRDRVGRFADTVDPTIAAPRPTRLGIRPGERLRASVYRDEHGKQWIRLRHSNGVVIFRPGTTRGRVAGDDWPDVESIAAEGVDLADLDVEEGKTMRLDVKRVNPDFDPIKHPRDRTGRFIRTNATVLLLGYRGSGKVTALPGNDRVQVLRDDGITVVRDRRAITVVREPDGTVARAPRLPPPRTNKPVAGRSRAPGTNMPATIPTPIRRALTSGLGADHPAKVSKDQRRLDWRRKVAAVAARMNTAPDEELMAAADLRVMDRVRSDPDARIYRITYGTPTNVIGTSPDKASRPLVESQSWVAMTPDERAEHDQSAMSTYTYREVPAETFRDQARLRGVSSRMSAWGFSSNDSWPRSIALQETASNAFGLSGAAPWDEDADTRAATDADKQHNARAHTAFLLAEYAETQRWLKARGIGEVTLYRAQSWLEGRDEIPEWATSGQETAQPQMRPISAWTADPQVAREALGQGFPGEVRVLMSGTFPADRILSGPRTGAGNLPSSEFLVLHGPGDVTVQAWRENDRITPGGVDRPAPVDAAAMGGHYAPDADPTGATATFANATGLAWLRLDDDGREQGFVRPDRSDPATTVRYDDMTRWTQEVDERGMQEVPPVAADPAKVVRTQTRPDMSSTPGRDERAAELPPMGDDKQEAVDAILRKMDRVDTRDMVEAYKAMIPGQGLPQGGEDVIRHGATAAAVQQWNFSSNDSHAWSLAVQEIAADLWDTGDQYPWPMTESLRDRVDDVKARHRPFIEAFLAAQHEATQEWFAARGITHVYVSRGIRFPADQAPEWVVAGWDGPGVTEVPHRPLTSWSADPVHASAYAGKWALNERDNQRGVVVDGTVPVDRVVATAATGFGHGALSEVVLRAGPGPWQVTRVTDDRETPVLPAPRRPTVTVPRTRKPLDQHLIDAVAAPFDITGSTATRRGFAVKVRHVRTAAGVETYGQPVGEVIVPDGPGRPALRVATGREPAGDDPEGEPAAGGMRPITPAERESLRPAGKKIPPAWTDVMITDDPNAHLLVVGKDAKGRRQGIYSAEHTAGQAAKKFARIQTLAAALPALDAALADDAPTDDDAAALLLIRKLGLRPGSTGDTGADKQAYGATTLQARHVTVSATGRTTFRFTGKKGVDIAVGTNDPDVAEVMRARLKGKRGQARLFATNEAKVRAYMARHVPEGLHPKDLRTLHANVIALDMIAKRKRPAKTAAEFKRRRREVAVAVSKALGNTPTIALASYINPSVFTAWEPVGATP